MDWQWSTAEATDCLNRRSPALRCISSLFQRPAARILDLYEPRIPKPGYLAGTPRMWAMPYRFYPGRAGRCLLFFSLTVSAISCLIRTKQDFSPHSAPAVAAGKQPDHPAQGALLKRFVQSLQEAAPVGAGIQ